MVALAVALLVVLAAACGDSDVGTTDGDTTGSGSIDVPTAEDSGSTDVPTASPDLLINCEPNIAADVPAFYADFFRCTDISVDGEFVVISGSNLPPHLSYYYGAGSDQFEEFDYSRGEEYRPNPNQIEMTNFTIRIPINPSESGNPIDARTVDLTVGDGTDYPQGAAGVALDGAAYFNPLAAPGDDIEDEKFTFDSNEGHPQQMDAYHYRAVYHSHMAAEIGTDPRGLSPEAQYYDTCDVS